MNVNARHRHGIVWIDRRVDAYIRRSLVDGAPAKVRPLLREALAKGPDMGGVNRAKDYFGAELTPILQRIGPLMDFIDETMEKQMNMRGFKQWIQETGFGNDYRMIKAFDVWADMVKNLPKPPALN